MKQIKLYKSIQELGTKPQVATRIIKFLNSNSKEALKSKGVKDRTTMVMETKKYFYKKKYDTTSTE
jgi:hypothetical protein